MKKYIDLTRILPAFLLLITGLSMPALCADTEVETLLVSPLKEESAQQDRSGQKGVNELMAGSSQADGSGQDILNDVMQTQAAGGQTAEGQVSQTAGPGNWEPPTQEEKDSWNLTLVNKTHPIPDDYPEPELTQLVNGHQIDSRVYPYLQQMFDAARAEGIYPSITSSYRTMEQQQSEMDQKVAEYVAAGYSQEEAENLAREWVAVPGTSEHQLGLSVDISASAESGQDPGTVWWWLMNNCYKYGFIKRYPEDKTEITGIINEDWHYRYVGEKAARIIWENGICLEEYLGEY